MSSFLGHNSLKKRFYVFATTGTRRFRYVGADFYGRYDGGTLLIFRVHYAKKLFIARSHTLRYRKRR